MFIKKLDILSPPITLYYKGENGHSSIFSGILSFIVYAIVFAASIYYFLDFINKENPSAYFFNRYIEDAGTFPINSSSMFNFIQIYRTDNNEPIPTDFNKIEIIAVDITIDNYVNNTDLSQYNHWLYGKCNNDTDTKGIGYLINQDLFTECACIRKYYDKNTQKYYETNDENYRWPYIIHGASHPKTPKNGVILKKCENTEFRIKTSGKCSSDEEISEYLKHIYINFRIIDQYADVLNYKNPFIKYLYGITSGIFSNSYTINHLNFNPALIQTHNGIFFDNIIEKTSYFFTQNEKITTTGKNAIIAGFYFWMQNVEQYYERHYKRLQDILSDIGGIGSITLIIAQGINFLVSNFIILLDTEDLVLNIETMNFGKQELNRRPTIFRKKNEIMIPPKKQIINNNNNDKLNNSQQSSNYQRILKEEKNIEQNNHLDDDLSFGNKMNFIKKNDSLSHYLKHKYKIIKEELILDLKNNENKEKINNKEKNNKDIDKYYKKGFEFYKRNNKETIKEKILEKEKRVYNKNINDSKYIRINSEIKNFNNEKENISGEIIRKENKKKKKINYNEGIEKVINNSIIRTNEFHNLEKKNSINDENKDKESDKSIKKQNFIWFNYFYYLICCGKNNPKIQYYEDFRTHIISEENIIQNHLNIYKLLKACRIEKPSNFMLNLRD